MSARNTYVRPMAGWYRRNPVFGRYMLREATSVALAAYALVLLAGAGALAAGPEAYAGWLAFLAHPLVVLAHVVALVAAAYHTKTWLAVSPKAMPPLVLDGKRVPDAVVIGAQYAGVAVTSLAVLSLLLVVGR